MTQPDHMPMLLTALAGALTCAGLTLRSMTTIIMTQRSRAGRSRAT
jgi:hypothetical protein